MKLKAVKGEALGDCELEGGIQPSELNDPEQLKNVITEKENLIAEEKGVLEEEIRKRKIVLRENMRKKFNYLPLILEVFKHSAEKGQLMNMYLQAKKQ